ncbi:MULTISPECIES: hypothetical protein [Lactobacillaceae]|uniref:Uncharacterized protein n=1 Tax=Limosilactobacillus alvi TaxID=990412 RepID=A0ABS2EQP5_9LACO|nr:MULTISPECIES: hypothetical protein [Lactobacillaceae]MBM6754819.1 hypothetical protein [Limosilactobacillus alvi]QLL69280.1 hypothetical protein GTO83_01230 [Lactobacillus sp. 3B(2020)]
MGIDLLIKVLGYEVIFWGLTLIISFIGQGNIDVFDNMFVLVLISLGLIVFPYWRQWHLIQKERGQEEP